MATHTTSLPDSGSECLNTANESTLFILPLEIRLQIYEHVLTTRRPKPHVRRLYDETLHPYKWYGNQNCIPFVLDKSDNIWILYINPALLCICKIIQEEAKPVLYSKSVFQFDNSYGLPDPVPLTSQIVSSKQVNWSFWKKLSSSMCISTVKSKAPSPPNSIPLTTQIACRRLTSQIARSKQMSWPFLRNLTISMCTPSAVPLETLAKRATGLRSIRVAWVHYREFTPETKTWDADIALLRLFTRIQGLEDLFLCGFFPKEWPGYLEHNMGVRVQTIRTLHKLLPKDDYIYDGGWSFPYPACRPKVNEVKKLKKYQASIEDLVL
jgi:hypothetical protein